MAKSWRFSPHDADRVTKLERGTGVPAVVAQLLVARGMYEPSDVHAFLDAKLTGLRDPNELPGVPQAVSCIYSAIQQKRKIVIYGDYDCDGMSGTAILFSCLRILGADVSYHIPNRLDEGYGLNHESLHSLAARGAKMVVTVDCGIASVDQAETAHALGLELIVTDHHEMADQLPRAAAIVHPRLPGHSYPFAGLCGAGVALKVAWALCQRACDAKKVNESLRAFLIQAVGLAALGAIADVVPLLDENRVLVRHGLVSLRHQPTLGISALLKVTKCDERSALSSEDIAFMIAPRLNAVGRLGQAQLGVELLTTCSAERALALAEYVNELNVQRDSVERSIYLAANKQIKDNFDPENESAFVLAGEGWHAGVIGIVAGRLAEKYHRPVVLIALDGTGNRPGMGSARTACGVNLHESLAQCGDLLLSHGGHAAAAGLRIDPAHVDTFRAAFCKCAEAKVKPEDLIAVLRIDAEAPLSQLTLRTVQQMEQLAPFGEGNPRPVLCASGVRLAEPPRHMGKSDRHLSVRVVQHNVSLRAIAFGRGDWLEALTKLDCPIDVAYRPVINEFRGRRSVEIQIVDWRLAENMVALSAS